MKPPLNNQSGLVPWLLIGLVACLMLVSGLAYLQLNQVKISRQKVSEPVVPSPRATLATSQVITESLFSLTLPVGWTKVAQPDKPFRQCDGTGHYYQNTTGGFFDVCADPGGRGLSVDELWLIEKTVTGFVIKQEGPMCQAGSANCAAGDSQLHILMSAQGDGKLAGHNYYFQAGNTASETATDLLVIKDMLASFKVK